MGKSDSNLCDMMHHAIHSDSETWSELGAETVTAMCERAQEGLDELDLNRLGEPFHVVAFLDTLTSFRSQVRDLSEDRHSHTVESALIDREECARLAGLLCFRARANLALLLDKYIGGVDHDDMVMYLRLLLILGHPLILLYSYLKVISEHDLYAAGYKQAEGMGVALL